jgi:hypothetical protein
MIVTAAADVLGQADLFSYLQSYYDNVTIQEYM